MTKRDRDYLIAEIEDFKEQQSKFYSIEIQNELIIIGRPNQSNTFMAYKKDLRLIKNRDLSFLIQFKNGYITLFKDVEMIITGLF